MQQQISKEAAIYQAWKRGLLTYKLDPLQKEIYQKIKESDKKVWVALCGRRVGKTFMACVMATQQCLSKPNSIVKFIAPTKLMLNTIIRPILKDVLMDCPADFTPTHVKNQYIYYFKNGSELHLAGSDGGHAEKLRGSFADLCIIDEAAFCNDLDNLIRSILIPTTMNTKGKIVLITTPPKDLEHDFIKFMEEADFNNTLIKKTIYDNPRIKPEEIESVIAAYPEGAASAEFQREYLCTISRDSSSLVLPEFTVDLEKEIIKEWKKPKFFDCYESMDLGYKDMTVILFAYYDFQAAKIIVEDEIALKGPEVKIPELAEMIKLKEEQLWTDPMIAEVKKPYMRVSDINYIVTEELRRASNNQIIFETAKKDDKESAINHLRVLLEHKKIIINPRCSTLIKHLKNVKWSNRKTVREFARGADGSHYDGADALIYLVRHLNYTKNPFPAYYNYNFKEQDLFISNPNNYYKKTSNNVEMLRNLFKPKGKNGR